MLGELGLEYVFETLDIRKGEQKRPEFLALNPMGKVPTLRDGDVVVTESVAICLYLADRYGYGTFAPRVDDPARGTYLRWAVFATSVLEPAVGLPRSDDKALAFSVGWGDFDSAMNALESAVTPGPYILGERFSAADVALGAIVAFALINKRMPERPKFVAYHERLGGRAAYVAAANATWPPELFPRPK
jgi:glutathione S-transferase